MEIGPAMSRCNEAKLQVRARRLNDELDLDNKNSPHACTASDLPEALLVDQ